MSPESLVAVIRDFLANARGAAVVEDGAVLFDFSNAKYSISGDHNRCLLHIWSDERNIVRRIVDVEVLKDALRLSVQRLGQTRPSKLEICRDRDRRPPSLKRAARLAYQRRLERVLARRLPDFKIARLSTGMDLGHSFGPIYARGLLVRGQSAFAVLGVNAQESQASIDAALTFGILWLDACRHSAANQVVHGLKLIVPAKTSALTRERMAYLNGSAAHWQLYEFDECCDEFNEIDVTDRGNIATRLVHLADEVAARERFAQQIAQVRQIMPDAEIAVISPAKIAFRRYGLEFAHATLASTPGSLSRNTQLTFGLEAEENVLTEANHAAFLVLLNSIGEVRHAEGPRDHGLWRMHPERWLESLVVQSVADLDERLDGGCLYSQVPAFSASDRAMIDVLGITRQGRLSVIELKADEDIHLPLQGLDYWSRVSWHHARAEFQKLGYFEGRQLAAEDPLLFLVAPALHVHPTTDTLLHYISPKIDWTLAAIDERWREGVKVVFRKRREGGSKAQTSDGLLTA